MIAYWKKWTEKLPGSFLVALLIGACFLLFIIFDQQHWWRSKADYSFGWLVPLLVAYVLYDRWPRITAGIQACSQADSRRVRGLRNILLNIAVYSSIIIGGLVFLAGAVYLGTSGSSHPGSLCIAFGSGFILMGMIFLSAPEPAGVSPDKAPPAGTGFFQDDRVKLTLLFLFPSFVWLLSAPMLSVVEQRLSLFLLNKVTAVVFFVFDTLGLPIEQHGNVLRFPKGEVGVADACSGIRSLTACLFVGTFLGAVFLQRFYKKVLLVVAAMILAVITNLLRSLFLTIWAYNYGSESINGFVHDAAGYGVMGLTLVGLLLILPLFTMKIAFASDGQQHTGDSPQN